MDGTQCCDCGQSAAWLEVKPGSSSSRAEQLPGTFSSLVPDADALMNPTEGLEDEESSVFNEVLEAGDQKEVIHKNLREKNS